MNFRRWLQQLIKSAGEVDFYALDAVALIIFGVCKMLIIMTLSENDYFVSNHLFLLVQCIIMLSDTN
jgi:hypothetical protein